MMDKTKKDCCSSAGDKSGRGLISGIFYGLLPHSFCLAFVLASIIGATAATAFFKRFLLLPNLFAYLVIVSFLLATLSAIIYLRKNNGLCLAEIKNRWRYLSVLYLSVITVNLLMFLVIMPAIANMDLPKALATGDALYFATLSVNIPCSGHAPLIIDEIKKNYEVQSVEFKIPGIFKIAYDPKKVSLEKIMAADIFKTYPAKEVAD